MIKPVSGVATACRRSALIRIIKEQMKDAHGVEATALLWMLNFIPTYDFKEGSAMEPTADLMKFFGMFVIFQYKDLEI